MSVRHRIHSSLILLLNSDCDFHQMEEMTTPDYSRLLALPDGVENHLLSFVSSGERGLQSILNLRQVCSTTKSWVDNLPKEQAKQIFSSANVVVHSKDLTPKRFMKRLQRFMDHPPPRAITALTLNTQGFYHRIRSEAEKQLWKDFFEIWSPKLETLQLINERSHRKQDENHPWTLQLLEIPTLRRLSTSMVNNFHWKSTVPFPLALRKVNSLAMAIHFNEGDRDSKEQFYSQLLENPNLKKFNFYLSNSIIDLECLREFIEVKKNDSDLLVVVNSTFVPIPEEVCVRCFREEVSPAFIRFVKSIEASKSEIQLKMVGKRVVEDCFDDVSDLVENDYQFDEFLRRITHIENWKPIEDPVRIQQCLQRFHVLEKITSFDVEPQIVPRLTFPDTLKELGIQRGFPTAIALPQNLTQLKLSSVSCDGSFLMSWLTALKRRCPCLETLELIWSFKKTAGKDILVERSEESAELFGKLRSLKFTAKLDKGEAEADASAARAIILKGFQVGRLELLSLGLHFKDQLRGATVPFVLNAELLNELYEGTVGSSLVAFWCDETSVSPGDRPLLQKLRSKTSENRKRREDTIGRGKWQRQHSIR